jgi:hypothetical protein
MSAATQLTTTHDEYWHLPIGLLNLKAGRFHFDNLNPPLCRVWAAVPLLFTSARTGPTDAVRDPMAWGDAFVALNADHYQSLFVCGRWMIVLLSVLGGLVTACWARQLFGNGAGCFAALLWAFEPNLIAHGSLVTTDMGAAAFFVFTLFAAYRFALRPAWHAAILFGVVLGLAQLVKFTSLLLYPTSVVVFLLASLGARSERRAAVESAEQRCSQRLWIQWGTALLISLVVLNAGYFFRGTFSPLRTYDFQSHSLRTAATRVRSIASLPVPLPRDYVEGLDHQRRIMEQDHPVYLDGQWSEHGFPRYYLWALFYKLPHALQLLAIASLLWLVTPGRVARRPWTQALLLVPAAAMVAAAEASRMQLGVRYVLPAIPFLILFASQAVQWIDFKFSPVRGTTTIVFALWMLLSIRYHPEHLAYFNELAGGPLGGREHLLDSNLDWGQDLRQLQQYLRDRGNPEIGLAYFGTVPPTSLGIRYHIPSPEPQPGRYAISVNFLKGRPHWVRTPTGDIRAVNIFEFAFFSVFTPVARIGESIDVFEISEKDLVEWRALRSAM